jgi:hypothetical protein
MYFEAANKLEVRGLSSQLYVPIAEKFIITIKAATIFPLDSRTTTMVMS